MIKEKITGNKKNLTWWRKRLMNDSDAIIRGIVEIADNLGARAVAEGVENERHAINMACNGCRYIQGNY